MTAARTIIGPLTTTFTARGYCANVVVACPYSCSWGWQAQQCVDNGDYSYQAEDATSCWPPASSGAPTPTPPFTGRGFYSPGIMCPSGWVSVCSATAGGKSGWIQEYSMNPGETAVGCCPSGYVCASQTCSSIAQSGGTVPVVTCSDGSSQGYSYLTIPATATVTGISSSSSRVGAFEFTSFGVFEFTSFGVYAPMVEIRWQSSDWSTPTPTASETSPSSNDASFNSFSGSGGLSTGAKAAIGVVVPVAVIAILLGIFFFWRRKIRKLNESDWADPQSNSSFRHLSAQPPMEASTAYKHVDDKGRYMSPPRETLPRELDAYPKPQELEGSKMDRADNG